MKFKMVVVVWMYTWGRWSYKHTYVVWLFLLCNFGIIINYFIFHLECKLIIMQFFKKIFYVTKSIFWKHILKYHELYIKMNPWCRRINILLKNLFLNYNFKNTTKINEQKYLFWYKILANKNFLCGDILYRIWYQNISLRLKNMKLAISF